MSIVCVQMFVIDVLSYVVSHVVSFVCARGYGLGLVCTTEFMTSYYDLVIKL